MKKITIGVLCTLWLVGCADGRRAEDPTDVRTTSAEAPPANDAMMGPRDGAYGDGAALSTAPTTAPARAAGSDDAAYDRVDPVGAPTVGATPLAGPGIASDTRAPDGATPLAGPAVASGTRAPEGEGMDATKEDGLADRDITAAIRRSVVADDALSFRAKNVDIRVSEGAVTLRGTVATAAEKTKIEALAKRAAGVSRVDNRLDVAK